MLPPDSTPKDVTHYTLQARNVKRSMNKFVRTPFVVGRGLAPAGLLNSCFCNGGSEAPRPTGLRAKFCMSSWPKVPAALDFVGICGYNIE